MFWENLEIWVEFSIFKHYIYIQIRKFIVIEISASQKKGKKRVKKKKIKWTCELSTVLKKIVQAIKKKRERVFFKILWLAQTKIIVRTLSYNLC